MTRIALSVTGLDVVIECADPDARAVLQVTYGGMVGVAGRPGLRYEVRRLAPGGSYAIRRDGDLCASAEDEADLVWAFDGDLVTEIQRRRPDLYFVHAAVLELGGRAFLLAAESGAGKSTTAWALLHHGFGFLSDELAPVDLASLTVHPYLRALCLKDAPPAPYHLPAGALRTSRSIHVSTRDLPGPPRRDSLPLAGIFFVRYEPGALAPSVRPLTGAEGSARLYANTLNALAHEADGLDGAIRIGAERPCFELISGDRTTTALLVKRTAEQLLARAA